MVRGRCGDNSGVRRFKLHDARLAIDKTETHSPGSALLRGLGNENACNALKGKSCPERINTGSPGLFAGVEVL